MLKAINPNYTENYSLREDEGDDKTVFTVGLIDSITRAFIDDKHLEMRDADGQTSFNDVALHDKYLAFVRFGLKGWSNFKDAEGNDVPFMTEEVNFPRLGKRTVVSDEGLKRLELTAIVELGMKITSLNSTTSVEKKS
jgi:hypothetical protein